MTTVIPADDDVAQSMLPLAWRLIDAVHNRQPQRVNTILRDTRAADCPNPTAALAVVLAELAPTPAEQAVITILRNADGPADADLLLDALGLAGRAEAA